MSYTKSARPYINACASMHEIILTSAWRKVICKQAEYPILDWPGKNTDQVTG